MPFETLNSRGDNQSREEWRQRFVITCWWLWRRQNTLVFEGKVISNHTIISSVSAMIGTMNEARNRLCTTAARRLPQSDHGGKWRPPPAGWVKINTDGAYSALSPGVASGGILRNDHSELLSAFMFKGNDGDSLTAELWGCLHGIKLAWDLGARNVILEVDATKVVTLLQSPMSEIHEDTRLITEIQSVLDREWKVEVQLISRWANSTADRLAKSSLSAMPGLHLVQAADVVLERILILDKA